MKQFSEILEMTKPDMLLADRLPVGSMGVLYGAPKVGKTFVTLDWAIRLARDGNSVLYCAGEGISGYGARCRAWVRQFGLDEGEEKYLPFYLGERMINFTSHGNAPAFMAEIRKRFEEEHPVGDVVTDYDPDGNVIGEHFEEFGTQTMPGHIDLVIVDTLSRSLPGVDENDQGEMSKAIDQIDSFRRATGSTVLFLHHTTKADKKKWRGSSVIEGAADVMILAYDEADEIHVKVEAAREFDSEDKEWVYKLTPNGDSAVAVEGAKPMSGKDRVLKAVLDGKDSVADISNETSVAVPQVRVYLGRLVASGSIYNTARGKYAPTTKALDAAGGES